MVIPIGSQGDECGEAVVRDAKEIKAVVREARKKKQL
jgi:hypothetical protein